MKIHGLFIIFSLSICHIYAQKVQPFTQMNDWQYVASENFDVYYSRDHQASAEQVARYAEIARYELGLLYDYSPKGRFILIYASDAFHFQYSNFVNPVHNERYSGVFNLPQREAFVLDPGNTKKLFQEVKKQVSLLMLREFSHENSMGKVLQNHLLLHNPQWFNEGLSEYVASGWTFEDEMWLHSVKNEDVLTLTLEGNEHINRVLRKSIWHYIVHEYTDQKLSEIIYLVNIAHSIESGIISVLGITLHTLTQRWREFILSHTSTEYAGRTEINQLPGIKDFPIKSGYKLSSFTYNERVNKLAVYLHKAGAHQLFIYDVESSTYLATPIKMGIQRDDVGYLSFNAPIAWNQDGTELAIIAYKHPYLELIYYDLETKESTVFQLEANVQRINSMSWSHDGARLVVSALVNGQVDLYTTAANTADFTSITNDIYDELDPSWSLDDQYIFFSSNRNPAQDETWDLFEYHYDLFAYQHNDEKFIRLTNTPDINERNPYAISSFAVNYLSDASGIFNVQNVNIFQKDISPISNLAQGIAQISGTESYLAFSTANKGNSKIFLLKNQDLQSPKKAIPTSLRKEYDKRLQIFQAEKTQLTTRQKTPPPLKQPVEPVNEQQDKDKKSKKENDDEPVRYYLFDEGDEPYEVKKPEKRLFDRLEENTPLINTVFGGKPRPKEEDINVSSQGRATVRWATDYLKLNVGYDPIAKYGLGLGVGFSDLMQNHQVQVEITPYLNFKNGDISIKYKYLKHRVDLYGEVNFSTRHFQQENFLAGGDSLIFRYDNSYLKAGVQYPLTSSLSAGFEGSFHLLNRKDLKLLRLQQPTPLLDASDRLASASIFINYDNVKQYEAFPYQGAKAKISANSFYSLEQNDFSFHTLKLDVDHYLEIYNKIVLATHLRGGFSLGNNRQQFYMGGINNWMIGVFFDNDSRQALRETTINPDLYAFQYQEFLSPVHGFGFSTREGSKYVLANFELRLPVSRLIRQNLNSGALYNVELIPFFDAGTVWHEGNPFSQKNPTDTQIVGSSPIIVRLQTLKSPFLFGFGTGLRVFMLGYSIRTDIGWGLDDNDLNSPIFSLSVGKEF